VSGDTPEGWKEGTTMFNTYERELIANQRHQEMLQFFAEQRLSDQSAANGQPTGLLTMMLAKLRGTTNEARLAKTAAARA
jgi:hypothetical protein